MGGDLKDDTLTAPQLRARYGIKKNTAGMYHNRRAALCTKSGEKEKACSNVGVMHDEMHDERRRTATEKRGYISVQGTHWMYICEIAAVLKRKSRLLWGGSYFNLLMFFQDRQQPLTGLEDVWSFC